MTEPGADGKAKNAWSILKTKVVWLRRRSVSWIAIIGVFAALGIAVAIFVAVGGVSVAADKPDGFFVAHGLHFVFKRSESLRSKSVTPPDDLNAPSRIRLAAQHFDMVCSNCHGRPGFGQSIVALSMSPTPQYLPKVLNQFTDSELYTIVEHGVKFSAMPSWATDARGDEVWSMVAFLRQLPKLDAKSYQALTALPAKTEPPPVGVGGDATLQPADTRHVAQVFDEFLYAAPASGFSDQTIHENPVATCARCHGADGSGVVTGGEAPNLTIQNATYLQAALKAYVSGDRKSGFMQTIADQLSAAQITVLSNYYANLPVQTAASTPANTALVARGEMIATEGVRESATPACDNCHESQGSQITGAPHIAGQSATFLRRQLSAMSRGGRGSAVVWNPMSAVAHSLSDRDIVALAAYYSGLKAAKTTGGEQAAQQPHALLPVKDVAAAKQIFETTCVKCHVNGGRGDLQGNYPNLTIQTKTYAAQSLYAFHAGARLNGKMQEVTDNLSLDQMTSLASYLNILTPLPALTPPDKAAALRGAVIAMQGAQSRGVPACLSCHSAKGIAALPLIPPLQGQSVAYLRRRLDSFARPYPGHSALNPMPAIARKLTGQERADLAAYFAAASPLQKAMVRP